MKTLQEVREGLSADSQTEIQSSIVRENIEKAAMIAQGGGTHNETWDLSSDADDL